VNRSSPLRGVASRGFVGRLLLAVIAVLVLGLLAVLALAWRDSLAPRDPSLPLSFHPDLVRRGAQLATLGDCIACHTARDGKSFAGGFPIRTQFGTIYGTNITPDAETGIGRWTESAFMRAMREGVDREGRHLYPAFPYNHFTRLTDEDIKALYGYFMTREPIRQEPPGNDLRFPFNFRPLIAGWNLLFLDRGAQQPTVSQSAEWNRGAYLVQGLAHCAACHTPRNVLGGPKSGADFAGGDIEGWHAPALNADSPARVAWTVDSLYRYLRNGYDAQHGVAAGPMAPVSLNLSEAPEQDVRAIAVYMSWLVGPAAAGGGKGVPAGSLDPDVAAQARQKLAQNTDHGVASGAAIYKGACASCHDPVGMQSLRRAAIDLSVSTALSAPNARNLIQVLHQGITPPEGERGPWMPPFAGALTARQVADLAQFLRASVGQPAWDDVEDLARKISEGKE
jgi:mono/diheme cytochrome c family protein